MLSIGSVREPEQTLVFRGDWWISSTTSERYSGTLTFTTGQGASLEINGSLIDPSYWTAESQIFGLTFEGQRITLLDPYLENEYSFGDRVRQDWSSRDIARGAWLSSGKRTSVKKIQLRTHGTRVWARNEWPALEISGIGEPGAIANFGVHTPEPLDAETEHGRLQFNWQRKVTTTHFAASSEFLAEFTYETAVPLDLEGTWETLVTPILHLMTLGTSTGDYFESMVVSFDDSEHELECGAEDVFGYAIPRGSFEWLTASWMAVPHTSSFPAAFEFLITFDELRSRFGDVIQRWFVLHKKLRSAFYVLFAEQMRSTVIPFEEAFLNAARALEICHGVLDPSKAIPKERFKEIKAAISNALDNSDESQLVKARLDHAAEFSLKQRIEKLTERTVSLVSEAIQRRDKFARNVVNSRNDLTHNGRLGSSMDFHDHVKAKALLETLITSIILQELGFENEKIETMLRRNPRTRYGIE